LRVHCSKKRSYPAVSIAEVQLAGNRP